MADEVSGLEARPARKSPVLRRAKSIVVWFALIVAGIAALMLIFVAAAPALLGWRFVIVAGGSMEPTIPFGSIAIMEDVDGDEVGAGDIIMFPSPGNGILTTHRVTAISEDGSRLVTKGDANAQIDQGEVPRGTVEAKYLFHVPEAGRVVKWLQSPRGYLTIILVPGIAIIAFEVLNIVQTVRRDRTGKRQAALAAVGPAPDALIAGEGASAEPIAGEAREGLLARLKPQRSTRPPGERDTPS